MITVQTQSVVIETLSSPSVRQGRWEDVQAEIQDEGEFILVSITARDYASDEVPQEIKMKLPKHYLPNFRLVQKRLKETGWFCLKIGLVRFMTL